MYVQLDGQRDGCTDRQSERWMLLIDLSYTTYCTRIGKVCKNNLQTILKPQHYMSYDWLDAYNLFKIQSEYKCKSEQCMSYGWLHAKLKKHIQHF